jgi:hypothetical protein
VSAEPVTALPLRAAAAPATAEDRAILKTMVYAGLFQFPLSLGELERRLMDVALDGAAIARRLRAPFLRARLRSTEGWLHPVGEEAWITLRQERRARAESLVARHAFALRALCRFPFVRLVALSGACAHGNATDDDVDVFLVVKAGRAFTVFGAVMALSKLAGLRRSLCVNYVLDERAMALPERDVFTASEVVGLVPWAGGEGYRRFVDANAWVGDLFPNFRRMASPAPHSRTAGAGRLGEGLIDLVTRPWLEPLARRVVGGYLRRKSRGASGVVLSESRLKLHLHDHRPALLASFEAAVRDAESEP